MALTRVQKKSTEIIRRGRPPMDYSNIPDE